MPEGNEEKQQPVQQSGEKRRVQQASESSIVRWKSFVDEQMEKEHQRRVQQTGSKVTDPALFSKGSRRSSKIALWIAAIAVVIVVLLIGLIVFHAAR